MAHASKRVAANGFGEDGYMLMVWEQSGNRKLTLASETLSTMIMPLSGDTPVLGPSYRMNLESNEYMS